MRVDVVGEELRGFARELEVATVPEFFQLVEDAASYLADKMQRLAPRGPPSRRHRGTLRGSIGWTRAKLVEDELRAPGVESVVGVSVRRRGTYHSLQVAYGTVLEVGGMVGRERALYMRPRPYVRPATEQSRGWIDALWRRALS